MFKLILLTILITLTLTLTHTHNPITLTYNPNLIITTPSIPLTNNIPLSIHTQTLPSTTSIITNNYYYSYSLLNTFLSNYTPTPTSKPLAVIFDIDETILSNIPFQSYIHTNHLSFTPQLQLNYLNTHILPTISPLTIPFINYLISHNITPIFVSNRKSNTLSSTITNLSHYNLPTTHIYLRTSTKDKDPRITSISNTYNIIQIHGDKLNDFPNDTITPTTILYPNYLY